MTTTNDALVDEYLARVPAPPPGCLRSAATS